MGIIYKATNEISGKCYIGRTNKLLIGPNSRSERHIVEANNGSNSIFHKALLKYGFENCDWIILKTCQSWEEAGIMETFMIMVHHSHRSEGGYNLTWGNDGGDTISWNPSREKIIEKIKDSRKRNETEPSNPKIWKKQVETRRSNGQEWLSNDVVIRRNKTRVENGWFKDIEKTKQKMSKSKKGKTKSDEWKQKMRKPKSDETKQKMSKSALGKPKSKESVRKSVESKKRKREIKKMLGGMLYGI